MVNKSKAMQAQDKGGRGCLWIFGGIFILLGGGFFILGSAWPLIQLAAANSWDETSCVIDSSVLETFDGDDGDTYAPNIRYSYAYGDGDYESDRYTFATGSSSGRKRHERVVNRYRPGDRAVCYVNPKAPSESVLSRGLSVDYFIGFFGLIFVGAGTLVIVLGTRQISGTAAKSRNAKPVGRMTVDPTGPITLEPKAGPVLKFVGFSFIALFWNGITYTVLFAVVFDSEGEGGSLLLYLFLTPFVLIGLLLVGGMGHAFLAMFNPRMRIDISHGAPRLGTEIELKWTLTGASHRVSEMRMWLEGREEARYTRGTDTYTDTNTFATIEIVQTNDRQDIRAGNATIMIPEYTMHSFDGGNNKIIWEIKVHGKISRWPDISEEYEFTLHPLAIGGAA